MRITSTLLTILVSIAIMTHGCCLDASSRPTLFPTPYHVTWGSGEFIIKSSDCVASDAPSEVADFLSKLNTRSHMSVSLADAGRIEFRLLKQRLGWMGDEGYRIVVTDRHVNVDANTAAGLYYGSLTLIQLVQTDKGRSIIPLVTIEDRPAMDYRGVMVDISRGLVPTAPTFERMIRSLSEMKINAVQPYIEDTYAFESYPFIGRDRGAWTPAEVREITQVAKRYHVDMSPCFESLGHMWQILKHRELASLRETPGVICPTNEASYDFLGKCYGELAATFPFPYLNAGCDETDDLGTGPSKAMADKIGVGKVYSAHLLRLDDLCRKNNLKMQFWGDMALRYPGVMADLPKNAIVMNWDYGRHKDFKSISMFKANGFQQIVCPGLQSWGAMFPDIKMAEPNIRGFIQEGKAAGVLGVLNTAWRDNGEVFYDYDWLGDAIGAECSWADQPEEGADFDAAFEHSFFGAHSDGLAAAYRDLADSLSLPGFGAENTLELYYGNPFKDLTPMNEPRCQASLSKLSRLAQEIRRAACIPSMHLDSAPYLLFAADRLDFMVRKYRESWRIASIYNQLDDCDLTTPESKSTVRSRLFDLSAEVTGLIAATRDLQSRYSQLWLAENKPEGLRGVMARYDASAATLIAMQKRLDNAATSLDKSSRLPAPDEMGLALPQGTPAGYRIARSLKSVPAWAPAGSMALQVHLDKPLLQKMPIRVAVASSALPDHMPPVAGMRQMDEQGKPIQTLACQVDRLDSKQAVLTFLLPEGSQGDLNMALDAVRAEAPDQVTITPALELKDGIWITNGRYRALLGPQGAHLFKWNVSALGGQCVTMHGNYDWSGFDDVGGQRDAAFKLSTMARGPICVRIDCRSPDGFHKMLTFYAGLGWYETRFDDPVNFFWDYDDPSVMGASSTTPGAYRFSDGRTGVLPPAGTLSYAERCSWVARYRPDGFTLGLISPESQPTLRAGPGDGMGGVGVEGGGVTRHLLSYIDMSEDGWRTVSDLYDSFMRSNMLSVYYAASNMR